MHSTLSIGFIRSVLSACPFNSITIFLAPFAHNDDGIYAHSMATVSLTDRCSSIRLNMIEVIWLLFVRLINVSKEIIISLFFLFSYLLKWNESNESVDIESSFQYVVSLKRTIALLGNLSQTAAKKSVHRLISKRKSWWFHHSVQSAPSLANVFLTMTSVFFFWLANKRLFCAHCQCPNCRKNTETEILALQTA